MKKYNINTTSIIKNVTVYPVTTFFKSRTAYLSNKNETPFLNSTVSYYEINQNSIKNSFTLNATANIFSNLYKFTLKSTVYSDLTTVKNTLISKNATATNSKNKTVTISTTHAYNLKTTKTSTNNLTGND